MEKIIFSISKGLHFVAQLILLLMMFLVTFDVFGRYFFNQPIRGSVELMSIGLALVVFFGLSYTHLLKEHITIDFLVDKLPQKVQYIFEFIINILIAILMSMVAWNLWENSKRLVQSNAVTGDLGLPMHIFYLMSVVGMVIFALTAIFQAIISIQKVVKGNES